MPKTRAKPEISSRDKILDTAEALFARCGYEGTGLREVAERSQLSKSALFHHFPNKLALFEAVLERILGDLLARLRGTGPETPAARLRHWVEQIIDALAENPTRAPLLLRSLFESPLALDFRRVGHMDSEADRILLEIIGNAAAVLEAGVQSGELRPLSVPHTLQSLIGMIVYHFASGEFGDELIGRSIYSAAEVRQRREHVLSFIQHGLLAEPPEGD